MYEVMKFCGGSLKYLIKIMLEDQTLQIRHNNLLVVRCSSQMP